MVANGDQKGGLGHGWGRRGELVLTFKFLQIKQAGNLESWQPRKLATQHGKNPVSWHPIMPLSQPAVNPKSCQT